MTELKKYNKIGIMGGTFNPIHNGHLYMANSVCDKFNLDVIVFIPTGNPPHKNIKDILKKEIRYEMTKIAIEDNNKFIISDIETKNENISYTIDTIKELKKFCNDNAQIYLIIGMDTLESIITWRNYEEVIKLVNVITVTRPNIKQDNINKSIVKTEIVDDILLEISSTNIRNAIKTGSSIKYLVPEKINEYIITNNLYKNEINKILIDEATNYIKNNLSKNRVIHSIGVRDTAKQLAKAYNINELNAEFAGITHDICKESCYDNEVNHGYAGSKLVKEKYNIEDDDVLNAIKYHTFGRKKMSTLEKIIFVSDYAEPNRKIENLEEIRQIMFTNLNKAVYLTLKAKINYVQEKGLVVDTNSLEALEYFRGEI